MNHIEITCSYGRGKSGRKYAYIRPAKKCRNRSRRCSRDKIAACIERHFPVVYYYHVDGFVIGAKDPQSALKEYWRVCEKEKIGKVFEVTLVSYPDQNKQR